jgi:hypothetical protein
MCHVAKTAQGLKGRVLKKEFILSIKFWIAILLIKKLHMVLHDVIFN